MKKPISPVEFIRRVIKKSELRDRGAAVSVAEISQPGQMKIGLDDYLVTGGRVDDLETFTLGGQVFRSASFWYGQWKLKAVLAAQKGETCMAPNNALKQLGLEG